MNLTVTQADGLTWVRVVRDNGGIIPVSLYPTFVEWCRQVQMEMDETDNIRDVEPNEIRRMLGMDPEATDIAFPGRLV